MSVILNVEVQEVSVTAGVHGYDGKICWAKTAGISSLAGTEVTESEILQSASG